MVEEHAARPGTGDEAVFSGTTKRDLQTTRNMALDAVQAKIMIADRDLNIVYMNRAVTALLGEAEAELKRDLPRFSMGTLVGSNIDVFHKNPAHQRGMLAGLRQPHSATIWVGGRAFDLRVTPLVDGGTTLGFAVEWTDARTRLLNEDYAAQIAAISRHQAVVEFKPDGTIVHANENFLRAVGYRLDEVAGRHHSMFVDAATRDSEDYRSFWQSLARGEHKTGQFRRIAKDGREIWINGDYNPIADGTGRIVKVMKFASDATAQVKLLADLKTLIDRNFSEIDGAIGLSTAEARSAAAAADDTAGNVNAVAASAEQLAASISEIARSMTNSRSATENAFQQAVAVEKNTESLANAAQAMNGIVGLIRTVASQINLLALNATIEAARAGEAGKGFAVVASEVKNLAVQAAKATEQISAEIANIQATSTEVSGALGAIREAVTTVRESVAVTASAVEEQSAVTRSMAANMQSASGGVSSISSSIGQITAAVQEAQNAVGKTKQAAQVLVR
jgi:PAS domain S-box-containing protein